VEANHERVLVLASIGRDAALTVEFLKKARLEAEACRDISDLTTRVREGCAAVIVAEESLDTTVLKLFTEYLEQQPPGRNFPSSSSPVPAIRLPSPSNA